MLCSIIYIFREIRKKFLGHFFHTVTRLRSCDSISWLLSYAIRDSRASDNNLGSPSSWARGVTSTANFDVIGVFPSGKQALWMPKVYYIIREHGKKSITDWSGAQPHCLPPPSVEGSIYGLSICFIHFHIINLNDNAVNIIVQNTSVPFLESWLELQLKSIQWMQTNI